MISLEIFCFFKTNNALFLVSIKFALLDIALIVHTAKPTFCVYNYGVDVNSFEN